MSKKNNRKGHTWRNYLILSFITVSIFIICVCTGSITVPVKDTLNVILSSIQGKETELAVSKSVIVLVRIPRVLCVALVGAALTICGASMQGLLKNPLADGSTLGVSAGASLGAVIAITFGFRIPGLEGGGTMVMAILFAFVSIIAILALARVLDYSLTTNTIILIGIIFSMFIGSIINLIIAFAGEKVKTIVFWTMGSLADSNYTNFFVMFAALIICSVVLLLHTNELNALAIGEDNARNIGINVRNTKLIILISTSVLIGISVSIGGTIGFVGLIIPHITRMITGPNHKRLLPTCIFTGASFLMLADLIARIIVKPKELPIGVVTSIIGVISFIYIFYVTRKAK
ncbi:FecCD family ABC transporter permease [Miniphocaeibacter massiliensis]|uniref:FecCD family ABC transporter permease n=1 Tax=Miniphocaeibacter massiliensis TaxID=2041841 RepID=UPI000C078E6E|nr:iron ABC transporter permease [Miniphocaeibacter massiliensis]